MIVFNDGVLRATLVENHWVCVEWLTDTIGYLSKTVVKDLKLIEEMCRNNNWRGWILGSELENQGMHRLIEKFGGVYHTQDLTYKFYYKRIQKCAVPVT